MRRALLILVLGVLALAAPASGSPYLQVGVQDDAWLAHGPGTLEQRLDRLESLGVRAVRFNLLWNRIAQRKPARARDQADPAYDWGDADPVLRGLRARGIQAVAGIVGAPAWSNGGRAPNWAPRTKWAFAGFAHAAASRYPWIGRWLVWNEPNQRRWLRPTTPQVYVRRLLGPGRAAIKRVIPAAKVAGGVTAPRGNRGGVSPVAWIRGMKRAGARIDAYAHHPYPLSPRETPTAGGCRACPTITMATLDRLVAEVRSSFGPARIWLTEYGYQTNPPDPLGVSYATQARYLRLAVNRAHRAPRVDLLIQFLVRDEPELGRWQSGLERADGSPKPSLAAFRRAVTALRR